MAVGLVLIASGPAGVLAIASGAILGLRVFLPMVRCGEHSAQGYPGGRARFGSGYSERFLRFVCWAEFVCGGIRRPPYGYPAAFVMSAVALIGAGLPGDTYFNILPPIRERKEPEPARSA